MQALDRLQHPEERSFDQLQYVGVALQCTADVRHVGVLFRRTTTEVRLLHLAWHCRVVDEPPTGEFSWVEPSIPGPKARVLSRFCGLLARKYARDREPLAYALLYAGGRFDPTTGDFISEGGHGLTCATFVLAVFASHGIKLLDTEQWPARDDDRAWQLQILEHLRNPRSRASAAHIAAVEQELPCARFRPQEVTAAGTVDALPLGYVDAERIGQRIVDAMLARASK